MKNKLISFMLLVLLSSSYSYSKESSDFDEVRDKVIEYVTKHFRGEKEGDEYEYYISKKPLKDTIVYGQKLVGEYWLLLVDQMPGANWEHPCKYVFVDRICNESSVCTIDTVCPPYEIEMERCGYATQTYSVDNNEKLVIPTRFSAHTGESSHTYAVILSGGINKKSNEARYWNDCSFIYNTLTKSYNVPKQNIKVLMSDGQSDAEDLNVGDFTDPVYISSPLDLDGDGLPEIEYPCKKSYLQMVIDDLTSKLSDEDHLLVFVTDHGGRNKTKSYICLWDGEKISSDEFADIFSGVNAGYITFVMGQCYSGGFTQSLKSDNRIVISACEADQTSFANERIPFDEFLCQFTSFVNGYDPYGNEISTTSGRTIKDAFIYAKENDVYSEGWNKMYETPTCSMLENSTAEDLSFSVIPPVVDLCLDNTGITDEELLSADNPNIDVRLLNEGNEEVTVYDFDIDNNFPKRANVEIRLYNHGVKEYKGDSADVSFWGYRASLGLPVSDFTTDNGDGVKALSIRIPIDEIIKPGEHVTKKHQCVINDGRHYPIGKVNYLAYISDNTNKGCDSCWSMNDMKSEYSKCAMKNVFDLKYGKPNSVNMSSVKKLCDEKGYRLLVEECPDNEMSLFEKADVVLFGGANDFDVRGSSALLSENITKAFVRSGVKISGTSEFRNVMFGENDSDTLSLECNFHADKKTNTENILSFKASLYEETTGNLIGTQIFRVKQLARPKIDLDVETNKIDGQQNYVYVYYVSEDADFHWFNESGDYVGEGRKINVTYSGKNEVFTAVAKSVSDGAIASAKVMVNFYSVIRSIQIDKSRQKVTLEFVYPSEKPFQIVVAPLDNISRKETYYVEKGSRSFTFYSDSVVNKICMLSIIVDGKVIESHKIKV